MTKEKLLNENISSEEPDWIEIDVNDGTIINSLDSDLNDDDMVEAILIDDNGIEIPETSNILLGDELEIGDLIIDESEGWNL
ncbi:MAG: hypothetical protein KA807_02565 [Prolixibacteraceae bacterium]|nr:hypothetical protein [Prolixibacteraceae bacterium]